MKRSRGEDLAYEFTRAQSEDEIRSLCIGLSAVSPDEHGKFISYLGEWFVAYNQQMKGKPPVGGIEP